MNHEIRNLAKPENIKFLPIVALAMGVYALRLATDALVRPYEEMRAERQAASIQYYETGGDDE